MREIKVQEAVNSKMKFNFYHRVSSFIKNTCSLEQWMYMQCSKDHLTDQVFTKKVYFKQQPYNLKAFTSVK